MKKNILLSVLLLVANWAWAQTQGISYQAMLSDTENPFEIPGVDIEGSAISEASLTIRFSILNEPEQVVYQEEQATTTDAFGMINVVIGTGTPTGNSTGNFSDIDWDGTPKNLRVEILLDEDETGEFSELSLQPLYYVPYAAHRNITATGNLEVDGPTTLNNQLNVENGAATNLSGSLSVEGASELNEQLTVNERSNLNGQVTIDANVNGNDTNYGAYPLRIEGSNQGIAIRVDGGRNESKNFVTFWDANAVHGSIEGQTLNELRTSFRFIWDVAMAGLEQGFILAEQIACGTQLDAAEVGVMLANNVVLGAQWVELTANYELNAGVSFNSGGADYAEWLEKEDPSASFTSGEIVGVKDGKISKNTEGASHLLVISTNPIVVGNLPPNGEEAKFEKVAFLGQVPVRVIGEVNKGDYILPSQNNDGLGIAKSPTEMQVEDYSSIIGVAWQNSTNDNLSYVNVGIGLNSNDLVDVVTKQQQEIDALKSEINEIKRFLQMGNTSTKTTSVQSVGNNTSLAVSDSSKKSNSLAYKIANQSNLNTMALSDEEFEQWLSDYGYIFKERMAVLQDFFNSEGIDYAKYPEVRSIIDAPTQAIRDMRNGKYMQTLWESFEQMYLDEY